MFDRLRLVVEEYDDLERQLADPEVIGQGERFRDLSREYADLEPLVRCFAAYRESEETARSAEAMLRDDDPEMRELAGEELAGATERIDTLEAARELFGIKQT